MRNLEIKSSLAVPVGQQKPAMFLRKAVADGHSAFLLHGPCHIGKHTLALYLAAMLNCPEENTPCGQCSYCRRILKGVFADVKTAGIETAEKGGEEVAKTGISTEQVKDIIESAVVAPYEGRAKVFIIDGAEYMSLPAANRLLKTLEEHQSYVYFILLAENADILLPTISSRLSKVEIKEALEDDITKHLVSLGADAKTAQILSSMAGGKTGWAVLALQNDDMVQERQDFAQKALDMTTYPLTKRLALAGELNKMFTKDRQSLYRLLDIWQKIYRDMLAVSLGQDVLVHNRQLIANIKEAAMRLNSMRINAFLQSITYSKKLLKQNVASLLTLEAMMLSL
ncbi:MAG: hypothetical protein FWF37_02930 [Chloroflexi bacterium]|nr:hypothetical protein [Chloroflexota bacterium]